MKEKNVDLLTGYRETYAECYRPGVNVLGIYDEQVGDPCFHCPSFDPDYRIKDKNLIYELLRKIIYLPFSDYMFFHTEEYLEVMKKITSVNGEYSVADWEVGRVFQRIIEYTEMEIICDDAMDLYPTPSEMKLYEKELYERVPAEVINRLCNDLIAPFMDMYKDTKDGKFVLSEIYNHSDKSYLVVSESCKKIESAEDIIRFTPWKYIKDVKEDFPTAMYLEEQLDILEYSQDSIPMWKALRSKILLALSYIRTGVAEVQDLLFQLLNNITLKEYIDAIRYLSKEELPQVQAAYQHLVQSIPELGADGTMMEYFVKDEELFIANMFSLLIIPIIEIWRFQSKIVYDGYHSLLRPWTKGIGFSI